MPLLVCQQVLGGQREQAATLLQLGADAQHDAGARVPQPRVGSCTSRSCSGGRQSTTATLTTVGDTESMQPVKVLLVGHEPSAILG